MPYKDHEKQRAYQANWMQKRRVQWLIANGPCRKCGSSEDLEVDHVDPESKVDHKVWTWSKERREAELAKCQVLCKACHREKSDEVMRRPIPHGTHAGYGFRNCRCDRCREAHRDYRRERRARGLRS